MVKDSNFLKNEYLMNIYDRKHIDIVYGKNATLYDRDKNDYIDFMSAIGIASVGHGNRELSKAICNQAKKVIHISNLYTIGLQSVLAKKMVELSGYSNMKCFFANSGAEANEGAIKIAKKHGYINFDKKRYKIFTLKNSFHGRTTATMSATGQKELRPDYFSPYHKFYYKNSIKDILSSLDNKSTAVMLELIQGEGGLKVLDKKEVKELESILKKRNILLIVDEVQTGVFRTGKFLASNLYNIKPDIITIAKALGGGVPISAVMSSKEILEVGDHGTTFGGNYLSMVASIKTLEILSRYKRDGKLEQHIKYFDKKLKDLSNTFENLFLKDVGVGFMRGIRAKSSDILEKCYSLAFKERVLILKSKKNTLRFLPPLTINKKEIDEGFKRLNSAFKKID